MISRNFALILVFASFFGLTAALPAMAEEAAPLAADPVAERIASLTLRERQMLDRVVAGKLNKTIADELEISIKTVELHRARMMDKMQTKSLAELIRMTARHLT